MNFLELIKKCPICDNEFLINSYSGKEVVFRYCDQCKEYPGVKSRWYPFSVFGDVINIRISQTKHFLRITNNKAELFTIQDSDFLKHRGWSKKISPSQVDLQNLKKYYQNLYYTFFKKLLLLE